LAKILLAIVSVLARPRERRASRTPRLLRRMGDRPYLRDPWRPDNLRWFWSMTITGPMTRSDRVATLEDAKAQLRKSWTPGPGRN
jgi:hypothetical protein